MEIKVDELDVLDKAGTERLWRVTDASKALEARHTITAQLVAYDTAVTTGDKKVGIPVPAELNGMEIKDVIAHVHDKGVTGTTDITLLRRRAGADVDVLSTEITIGDEYHASDGVVNTSNDDLATGDLLFPCVDAIHTGTAPNGLWIGIVVGPPNPS